MGGRSLMGEDLLDNLVMEAGDMVKNPIRGCASFGHQTMNVRMEVDAVAESMVFYRNLIYKKSCFFFSGPLLYT
jgi:hypothetical protein